MKKYLLFVLAALTFVACKPTVTSTGDVGKKDMEFPEATPGKLFWTGSGGRANKDFKGTFDKWMFTKFNVPKGDYSKIEAEIVVDIASINVDPDGLENHLRQDDYLDAKGFPKATISIKGAQQPKGMDSWVANGTVSIKGMVKQDVSIDFKVGESKPVTITGSTTIFRKDYKVGDMESESVKNGVKIEFDFTAPK